MLGRGLKLVDGNENEWELNQLLFADDTVVVVDSVPVGDRIWEGMREKEVTSECG